MGVCGAVMIALDWTFQVLKNIRVPGLKACFTMNTDTGEIAAAAYVSNTSVSQINHLVNQLLAHRPKFWPKVVYTNTWPHNQKNWEKMLGLAIMGRLGLFHFMKRLTDTLNPHCGVYWKALSELWKSVYQYDKVDETSLIKKLKDDEFSTSGKKHTSEEIEDLRNSKRCNQRYSSYLRKIVFPAAMMAHRLQAQFFHQLQDARDDEGKPFFWDAEKTIDLQIKNAEYIKDPPNF
jgi:hypothetical protein